LTLQERINRFESQADKESVQMAWKIAGTYLANCSCNLVCPCPIDGPPTSADGHCHGHLVFSIAEGNLDDTDLSGVNVGLVNLFPENLTAGGWKLGIVVDEGATDEQAQACERIFKGEEGGPFGEFAALTDEWLGMDRAPVTFSDGDTPSFSIGKSKATFEPVIGPDGSHAETTVHNAPFGFAPEFRVGRAPGKMSNLGIEFDAIYGETAEFMFADVQPEGASVGRG
jgi:hypothetical protein